MTLKIKEILQKSRKIQSSPTGNCAFILLRHCATHSFRARVLGNVGGGLSTKLRKFFFGNPPGISVRPS